MGRPNDDIEGEFRTVHREVILVRHGIAEEPTASKPDEERSLTAEGHARMKKIARGLEEAFPKAQVIYSSPLLRAVQTALWISKGYRSRIKVKTTEALVPHARPEELVEFLKTITERRIVLVGHEPNLSTNLIHFTGAREMQVDFKKGAAAALQVVDDGEGILQWFLSPRILRKLGEE